MIKLWDLRNTSSPLASYHGHVPASMRRLKRIHRPTFYNNSYILSGGEGSSAISMFQQLESKSTALQSVYSRGKLPHDVGGDIGSLAVQQQQLHSNNNENVVAVAVAVEGGEVLLLSQGLREKD